MEPEDKRMGFDGIPKPTQITPRTDSMNPYLAANLVRAENAEKPLIQKPSKEEQIKALQEEQRQYHDAEDEEEGEVFSEEEAEQIRMFAKMRGLMNIALDTGKRYEFHINPDTGLVDLRELESGVVVMQLLPEELMSLSEKMQRYAGMLMDKSG